MQVSVRSYLTAGVAVVGAGAIALSPVSPITTAALRDVQVPAIHVSSQAVALAATVDPLTWYTEVFQRAAANTEALFNNIAANPAPILTQIIYNQTHPNVPSYWPTSGFLVDDLVRIATIVGHNLQTTVPASLQLMVEQLAAANVQGAVDTLLTLPIDILSNPDNPFQNAFLGALDTIGWFVADLQRTITSPITNIVNVINAIVGPQAPFIGTPGGRLFMTVAGLFGPLLSGVGAAGTAVQDVIDAAGTGNPMDVMNAIVNAPATLADGFLNGGYGPPINAVLFNLTYPGLLTGSTNASIGLWAGTIQTIINLRNTIAVALGATLNPVPASASSKVATAEVPGIEPADINTVPSLNKGGSVVEGPAPQDAAIAANEPNTPTASGGVVEQGAVDGVSVASASASESAVTGTAGEGEVLNAGTPNKATSSTKVATTRNAGEQIGAALQSLGDQLGKKVNKFGNDLKKALTGKTTEKPSNTTSDSGSGASGSAGAKHRSAA